MQKTNYSQRGVRMGPNASGKYTNKLIGPQLMPPALRKFSPRGTLGFLRARGQIRFPASMHTDACLGRSAAGYQSWKVAYGVLEVRKFNVILLAGPAATGHDAKGILTQKAKVGFCPFCVQATRIAAPYILPVRRKQSPDKTWQAALGGRRYLGRQTSGGGQLCFRQWWLSPPCGLGLSGRAP